MLNGHLPKNKKSDKRQIGDIIFVKKKIINGN